MKVTTNNYETFLIDYLDGKLSAAEVEEVLLFLENHPEIKEEFEGINEVSFVAESISFNQASLLKPQYAEVKGAYENLLVAQLEGDLTMADQFTLQQGFLLYPELRNDEQLFAQTRFTPDMSVVFANKNKLHKGPVWVLQRNTILRVAAILLMTAFLGYFGSEFRQKPANQTAYTPVVEQQINSQPQTNTQPQINNNENTVLPQQENPQVSSVTKTNAMIHTRPHQFVAIVEHKQQIPANAEQHIESPSLSKSDARLSYVQPAEAAPAEAFMSLGTFLKDKLSNETRSLENKTINTIQDMNKTAGVNIQKDSSGRITSIEIAALGFEWSHSK
jgi:hypothetical protein